MILSEEEIMLILKKALPTSKGKDLESIAESIVQSGKHWQEIDLKEHIHDDDETETLNNICKRKNDNNPPQGIRLFFKK